MAAALVSVHLAAAASLATVLPAAAGAGASTLVLLLGAVAVWNWAMLRGGRAVRGLELGEDGAAMLVLGDGQRVAGRVGPRRNVGRWWVMLPVRGDARRTVVVARDMLPADDFRRLRIWALWGRVAPAAEAPLGP
jgi:hypothetical protein